MHAWSHVPSEGVGTHPTGMLSCFRFVDGGSDSDSAAAGECAGEGARDGEWGAELPQHAALPLHYSHGKY